MGYIYTQDKKLCCDICGKPVARKRKCPFGWCQAYAICPDCWKKPEVKKAMSKEAHATCKTSSDEYTAREQQKMYLYSKGEFVRCSAITRDDIERFNVEVTFRNGDYAGCQHKKVLMEKETYHSIPLLVVATIEDYEKKGLVIPLNDIDKSE